MSGSWLVDPARRDVIRSVACQSRARQWPHNQRYPEIHTAAPSSLAGEGGEHRGCEPGEGCTRRRKPSSGASRHHAAIVGVACKMGALQTQIELLNLLRAPGSYRATS
jgi:hypothetical protein